MEMGVVLLYIFFVGAVLVSYILMRKYKYCTRAKFPPGSMGWPYIGETFQFYSQDPNVFFASKQKRYGEIFKTHLLGYPCVMLASPEATRFVLVTQAHLFKPTYPRSKELLIGPSALFFHKGDYHTRLRKLVQGPLSPDAIRNLVPDIESISASVLDSWAGGRVINTFHEMKKLSFDVGILCIFGRLDARYKEQLKKNYFIVDNGYNSFPTNIPGTAYNKAVKARKRLAKILSEIVYQRKEKGFVEKDLLGHLMKSKGMKGEFLTDDQIADNIIGVLFAAQDTTASVLTWILKYLHDNPKLLEAIRAEQRAIHESNEGGNIHLTWSQTRNMPITYRVIMESLRMASIISFTFREAVADVEYKGYLIPKGWKVMPLFRNIHHNPEFFPDPQKFDPSRFEVSPKPNTFVPFGNGVHACPGNELAKLEMLIFIHHLVTKFRWEVVGPQSGIEYGPFPVPKHGLPAKFWKESSSQRYGCA
ncbi:abscisic acid 8'-hydroxylase 4-like [Magnolia sinica]|uniref:abscisic acid 8'-hydroxylase 4-like n=1 Tax=Magnolia sinica TaxID=86752 RepID=UPI00265B4625|nr:abscisic acid 8'-hydroxylase 4-like [Magnolia sinica]